MQAAQDEYYSVVLQHMTLSVPGCISNEYIQSLHLALPQHAPWQLKASLTSTARTRQGKGTRGILPTRHVCSARNTLRSH
eukprot:238460-Pelagomonas_calceolata.AAC.2